MKKQERDFNDSFLLAPIGVPLRKGRKHSLKSHARKGTLVYEVLGILDLLAANDPEHRFVFIERPSILKLCNKGRRVNAKKYSMSMLQRVLAELQARHIVSPYFKAWDGRYGFVVEPHDARCRVVNKVCFKHAPKRYECHPAVTPPVTRLSPEKSPACHSQSHPMGEKKSPDVSPQLSPDGPLQPNEFTDFTEDDAAKWLAERVQIGAPNRCIRLSGVAEKTVVSGLSSNQGSVRRQEQRPEQPQTQERERSFSLETKPETAEARATPKDARRRRVLSADEYAQQKTDRDVEELKAELAARSACTVCGVKHPPGTDCVKPKGDVNERRRT